jgi:hypothetical protein
LSAGDTNVQRDAINNPTNAVDPSGTDEQRIRVRWAELPAWLQNILQSSVPGGVTEPIDVYEVTDTQKNLTRITLSYTGADGGETAVTLWGNPYEPDENGNLSSSLWACATIRTLTQVGTGRSDAASSQ